MNSAHRLTLSAHSSGQSDFRTGSIFFVGTATVIIRYAGFTILTDPNFLHQGDHVHLGYGLTSSRLTNPAIELEDLPPIDLVVLSHMHDDHFDHLVQKNLDKDLPTSLLIKRLNPLNIGAFVPFIPSTLGRP